MLTPHTHAACQKCGEAFDGASQRLAQRHQAEQTKRAIETASTVGNVAVGMLGAIAGTGIVGQVVSAARSNNSDSGGNGGGFFESLLADNDPSDNF